MSAARKWAIMTLAASIFFLVNGTSRVMAQQPIVLKAVTAWSEKWVFNDMYFEWIKRVNERAKGRLEIKYIGGPEVYPAFEQLDPLKRGVIDTIDTSTGYVAGVLPDLNSTWFGFGVSPSKLREAGLFALLDRILREKAGVTLIGSPLQMRFNLFLNKPIHSADLSGLKIRSTPSYDPALKNLGAATVTMPPSELYTALQTGVVDGTAWPAPFIVGPGFAKVIKYKIMPPWWVGTDVALMNAKSFDALPDDLKKLLIDTMKEIETEVPAHYLNLEKKEDIALKKMGVKFIYLPSSEVERVRKIYWKEGFKAFIEGPSPAYAAQLKAIMKQFAPQ